MTERNLLAENIRIARGISVGRWKRVTSLILLGVVIVVYMEGNFRALRGISEIYLQRNTFSDSVKQQKFIAADENDLLDHGAVGKSPQTVEIEKLNAAVINLTNQLLALKASSKYDSNFNAEISDSEVSTPLQKESLNNSSLLPEKELGGNFDSNFTEEKKDDAEITTSILQTESSNSTLIEQKETFKSPEFPFPKTCVFEQPPSGIGASYEIAIYYHVGFMNNWRSIVWDQLDTLEACGLGYMASSMTVSHHTPSQGSTGSLDELVQIINDFPFSAKLNISYIEVTSFPYEKNILDSVSRTCRSSQSKSGGVDKREDESTDKKRLMVFYFHNKGCTKEPKSNTYNNVLHWRRYMEWFIHEKPTLCLRAMLYYGASTCGVNFFGPDPSWHYSGNFWAASCDWIISLPAEVESGDYYAAEWWIGRSIPQSEVNYTKHINFFNSEPFGNTYEVPIVPKNYGNLDEHKTGKYADLWNDYLMNLNGTAVAN